MKKVIRLTESDLARIVKRVVSEQTPQPTSPAQRNPQPATPKLNVELNNASLPVFTTAITDQQKLNTFLSWYGTTYSPTAIVDILNQNGFSFNNKYKNVAAGKFVDENGKPMSEEQAFEIKNLIGSYAEATNIALKSLISAKGYSNLSLTTIPNYQENIKKYVISQVNTLLPQTQVYNKTNLAGKAPFGQNTNFLTPEKFGNFVINILTQQLRKISG